MTIIRFVSHDLYQKVIQYRSFKTFNDELFLSDLSLVLDQSFLRNSRPTEKLFGHVLECWAWIFGESGSVNQCGTKGKVMDVN